MRRNGLLLTLTALAACSSPPAPGPLVPLRSDDPELAALNFMCGAWISDTVGSDRSEEHWTHASSGSMLGVHRFVQSGRTRFFEFLRIVRTPDGITYFASPAGAAPTAFPLVEQDGERAVFHNPEHDFPQRIIYWRSGDGILHARAEGQRRGQPDAVEYAWRPAAVVR